MGLDLVRREEGENCCGMMAASAQKRDILDLTNQIDKKVHVRFQGGREVTGILKGYDQLVNIVLDETEEFLRDPENPEIQSGKTRKLGMTVCRGNSVMLVCPADGMTKLSDNPYGSQQE